MDIMMHPGMTIWCAAFQAVRPSKETSRAQLQHDHELNTQYMHSVWFNFELKSPTDKKTVLDKLKENPLVAMTERKSANEVFSFGRDHGYYGRILSQTAVRSESAGAAKRTGVWQR